jgi:hypothetical protein
MASPGVVVVCWHGRDMGFQASKVWEPDRRFMIPLIRRLRRGQPADSDDADPV